MAKQLPVTEKAARTAAVVSATGAGSILAWFAGAFAWMTGVAVVAGAWGWVGWESARARARPAPSTLYLMAVATGLLAVALLWPLIEPRLRMALQR